LLLFFGALPKDIVHEFAGHQDTKHSRHFGHGGPVIEKKHHHCDYVDFAVTPFSYDVLHSTRSSVPYLILLIPMRL